MKEIIKKFLSEYEKSNKKRFDLDTLEKFVIDSFKGYNFYNSNGGYLKLHDEIMLLKKNQYIKEIDVSNYNGLNPPLKTRWQITSRKDISKWDKSKILQLSDVLDFSYYKNHPMYQTDLEWDYIENIHRFLKSKDQREWVSIEERSLELFYDEKFLIERKDKTKGKHGILKRLKLNNEDLKMKKYGEMFIYWNKGVQYIKNIIILENHSTFFTYKRIAENKGDIFGFKPDILIYGEGKKIESSISFLEEIADISKVEVLYFGDIDSEGLGIYFRLKERYPLINIRLQHEAYIHLLSISKRYYPLGDQEKNSIYLNYFLGEIEKHLDDNSLRKIRYIWDKDFRIPQELINYEYLLKVKQ
ncbi:MAG: DUF2220 family protein [Tissierellia bacterium]|nr:DUF2220 family protein [Tissierellia bacterium]